MSLFGGLRSLPSAGVLSTSLARCPFSTSIASSSSTSSSSTAATDTSARIRADLFYDIVSPYAWISFESWQRYAKVWPVDLRLRPFYLPGIFKATGNIPPISIPNKDAYLRQDLERLNEYWGTDLVWHEEFRPQTLKASSIYAQRLLAAVQLHEPDMLVTASRALWSRVWHQKKSVYSDEDVLQVAESLGLKCRKKIVGSLKTDEVKNVVVDNTNAALETKAFGTPWVVLYLPDGRKEVFFGCDRMHLIAQTLKVPFLGPLKEMADH